MAWKNLFTLTLALCAIAITADAAAVMQSHQPDVEKLANTVNVDGGFGLPVDPNMGPNMQNDGGKGTKATPPTATAEEPTTLPPPPPDTVNSPRKITFADSKDFDFDFETDLPGNEVEFEVGSEEDKEASQWVVMTPSGYEYDGSPDVLREIFIEANVSTSGSLDDMISQYGNPGLEDISTVVSGFDTRSKRTVFGADTRERVSIFRYPYSAMGQIDRSCTGTFIGPRHILTAGHCIYNRVTNQWYNYGYFYRAKNCDPHNGVGPRYRVTYALSVRGWTRSGLRAYDYGMIVVDRASPNYMSYGYDNSISSLLVNIAGYPGELSGNCLWRTSCRTAFSSTNRLYYRCDTSPGMSGSAVYAYWSANNRRVVYGVHTSSGSTYNGCSRITRTRFELFQRWIRDY